MAGTVPEINAGTGNQYRYGTTSINRSAHVFVPDPGYGTDDPYSFAGSRPNLVGLFKGSVSRDFRPPVFFMI